MYLCCTVKILVYGHNIKMPTIYVLGARCVATLLNEMKRRGKDCRFGVVSMCIGPSLPLSYI